MTARVQLARDRIVKASITVIGEHVVGVDSLGFLCKLKDGRWRRLALAPHPGGRRITNAAVVSARALSPRH